MNGADAVVHALRQLDVDYVFGIISIHNMPIFEAIKRDGHITAVDCRHELGAAHAADGYARISGKPGVVIASTGPGTTNTVTGLYEAQYASSPLLLITGQAETRFYGKGQGYVHEAEQQLPMLRTVTRRAESIRAADQIASTIVSVVRDMLAGRPSSGAVEIPIDLQYAEITDDSLPSMSPTQMSNEPAPANVQAAATLINASQRRVIIAGGGVIRGEAADQLQRLAESLDAPVFTTHNGRGAIPEDHPLSLGNLYQSRKLHAAMADAEVTIAIGTRFQVGVGGAGAELTPPGKLIHLDADPAVINRVHPAQVAITGDAGAMLSALQNATNAEPGDAEFLRKMQTQRDQLRETLTARLGPDFEGIMHCVREKLPRDGVIVRDTTVPAYNFANQLLHVYGPRTFIGPASAAIGPGMPLSIGAAVASEGPVVVIHGDGGFMLHATELATAAQYNLPLTVCVFNDGGYGVLRGLQAAQFEGRFSDTDLGFVDFAGLAESMGVRGTTVQTLAAFEDAFAAAVVRDGPDLINIDMRHLQPMKGSMLPAS